MRQTLRRYLIRALFLLTRNYRISFGLVVAILSISQASRLDAGFTGTDVFIPAVARADGTGGSHFYSTLWMTNLTASNANVTIQLLLQGQANPSPLSKSVAVPPAVTQRIDDVVGGFFGVNGKGAALQRWIPVPETLLLPCRGAEVRRGGVSLRADDRHAQGSSVLGPKS